MKLDLTAPLPDGYIHGRPFWTVQQLECFIKSLPQSRFFEMMEPRTGKTDPVIAKTCYYFERKSHPLHVTGMLVIAFPNGVHRGWATEGCPENIPRRIKWSVTVWRSNKCKQVAFQKQFEETLKTNGLAVLTMNAEAIGSKEARTAIGQFLKRRGRVHVVFDESSALVNSDALRTRVMFNIGAAKQFVKLMTNLDGTPVDRNGPFDYWSQIGWMGRDILGYESEVEFRNRYAEIVTRGRGPFWAKVKSIQATLAKERPGVDDKELRLISIRFAKNEKISDEDDFARIRTQQIEAGKSIEDAEIVAEATAKKRKIKRGKDWWTAVDEDETGMPKYRNMDEIWKRLDPISYRATFRECFPDAHVPVYQKRFFQLTDKQRKVYEELQKRYRVNIDGDEFKAEHPLTRQLRAQQITSNYYPDPGGLRVHDECVGMGCAECDGTGTVTVDGALRVIDKENPRLNALKIELNLGKPVGIWCRFRPDVDSVLELARSLGISACRYDGQSSLDEKEDSKQGFQKGKYDLIVGNEMSLSRGIPLFRAEMMIGYSNLFSYRTRLQVEVRAEHGSKRTATQIIDLVAEETVDDLCIIPALRSGMDVADYINRDKKREWI